MTSVFWLQNQPDAQCEGARDQLAEVWDPATRESVRQGMIRVAPLAGPASTASPCR